MKAKDIFVRRKNMKHAVVNLNTCLCRPTLFILLDMFMLHVQAAPQHICSLNLFAVYLNVLNTICRILFVLSHITSHCPLTISFPRGISTSLPEKVLH